MFMNFRRVWVLTKPSIGKIIDIYDSSVVYLSLIVLIICSTVALGWNGQNVIFLGISQELYGSVREEALQGILHEFFSWWWIFTAFFYLLPRLLSPLGDSFLVSQSLWLRLTPCTPFELAFSKILWVISCGIWVGFLGIIWAFISSLFHHLPLYPSKLLVDILGMSSYIFLAGGIVLALDFGLMIDYSGRRLISTIALFTPILLLLSSLATSKLIDNEYVALFPYSAPFARLSYETMYHFLMAAVVGVLLLGLHGLIRSRYSVHK